MLYSAADCGVKETVIHEVLRSLIGNTAINAAIDSSQVCLHALPWLVVPHTGSRMHIAVDSLGSNGGGKVVEDVVHLLHGLDLQHEAGNLPPPHLHHTCYTALTDWGLPARTTQAPKHQSEFSIQEQWPGSSR